MRLINVKTGKLEEFHENIPPYAILSHTWGPESEEISFRDAQEGHISKPGFGKVKFDGCCRQAQEDGLDYAWIDTCCIDKTNAVELGEAINSMFRWYQTANVCYAILADVSEEAGAIFQVEFRASRWFERGWTLQELVAPRELVFYNNKWKSLGSKKELAGVVADVTGIPPPYLLGIASLQDASVAQRMSWAANRTTKRKEDVAYSLLGIFNVMIPMIYGEGDMAFIRLQEEIMRKTPDDSILAWDISPNSPDGNPHNESKHIIGNALASSPASFADSGMVVSGIDHVPTIAATGVSRGYLHARLPLHIAEDGQTFGLLNCRSKDDDQTVVGIPLCCVTPGDNSDEFMRPAGSRAVIIAKGDQAATSRSIRIIESPRYEEGPNYNRRYGFYIEVPSSRELDVIDVHPKERWESKTSFIFTGMDFSKDSIQRTWVKVRHAPSSSQDFVVALELEVKESKPQARCHLMVASRGTTLERINEMRHSPHAMEHLLSQRAAGSHSFGLQVTLTEERLGAGLIFVVRLVETAQVPEVTVNADAEMELLQRGLRLQKLFAEDQEVRPKLDAIAEITQRNSAEIVRTRQLIQQVEQELRDKEEERQQLSRKLKTKLEERVRTAYDYAQFKIIDENIDETITKSQGLYATFGQQRCSAWVDAMLDHLSQTLPDDHPPVNSMPEKMQRVFMKAVASGNVAAMSFVHAHLNGSNFEDTDGHGILSTAVRSRNLSAVRWVIEKMKLDINRRGSDGSFALHQAVRRGFTDVARLLLDHGASLDLQCGEGWSPIHLAAEAGSNVGMARLLLDRGADVHMRRANSQITPLIVAAKGGNTAVVKLLLERGALNQAMEVDGATPLHMAAEWGEIEVALLLLRHGADVEAKANSGVRTLHAAAGSGNVNMVELLLGNGADVEAETDSGARALHAAAGRGNVNMVELLLGKGAHMEAKAKDGFTPLLMASFYSHCACIRLLLDRGADIEAKSGKGMTPLHTTIGQGNAEAFQVLLDRGANIESADARAVTPLMTAAHNGLDDIVAMLLQKGAKVEAKDQDGDTALFYAIGSQRKCGAVGVLLDHGADMNVQGRGSRTPLHEAVQRGQVDAVRQLIEKGADVSIRNAKSETALQHARGCAQEGVMLDITKMLKVAVEQKKVSPPPTKASPIPRASKSGQKKKAKRS